MTWPNVLLLPQVVQLARRAPRDVGGRWDRYWAAVRTTGTNGDVLWDVDSPAEARRYQDRLREHADPTLPVIDVGCGNGRYTRLLAETFPFALGVDLSPHAITRAEQESRPVDNVAFRTMDLTAPGSGRALATELGAANVFIRGVLHVLPASQRATMAGNLRDVLGIRGTLLLAETAFPGSVLSYLGHLGATPGHLPAPLGRAIAAGLPRPARFAAAEKAACFPAAGWVTLAEEDTTINAVPMQGSAEPGAIPGFLAVLRVRPPAPDVLDPGRP